MTAAVEEEPAARRRLPLGLSRGALLALVGITLLAGALRAANAAAPDLGYTSEDERGYAGLAVRFSHGHLGGGTLHWAPGAAVAFAVAERVHRTPQMRASYWLQALLGTALIPVVFLLGLLAHGPRVGLVAAGLLAVYPPYVVLGGQLLAEPLGTLLLTGGVAAVLAAWRAPRKWLLALAGALLGATVLTRADLILVPAILAALTAWRLRPVAGAIVLAAAVVVCLPWVIVASSQAGHFVPVTEGDGPALFVGTYLPGDGTTIGLKRSVARDLRTRHRRYAHTRASRIPGRVVLDDIAAQRHPGLPVNAALRAEARANLRRYALGDPLSFARMMAGKAGRMWLASSRVGQADYPSRSTRPLHTIAVALLGFALLAAWALRRPPALTAFVAVIAYATLLHAIFVSKPRYALPLLPLLAVGGLAGAVLLYSAARSRQSRAAPPR